MEREGKTFSGRRKIRRSEARDNVEYLGELRVVQSWMVIGNAEKWGQRRLKDLNHKESMYHI